MAEETPDYLKDYLKDVSNPYERSLIGNYFSKQREQEAYPTGEELFPEEQVAEPTEQGAVDEGGGFLDIAKDSAKDIALYSMGRKGIGMGLKKLAPRLMGYAGTGGLLGVTDALDFLLPEGYSPYEGFGLAPKDNPVSDFLSWGNIEHVPEYIESGKELYDVVTGE